MGTNDLDTVEDFVQKSGVKPLNDDELDAVAGGSFFQKCWKKKFELQFPERECKGCPSFEGVKHDGEYYFYCYFFQRCEVKNHDLWDLIKE